MRMACRRRSLRGRRGLCGDFRAGTDGGHSGDEISCLSVSNEAGMLRLLCREWLLGSGL